MQDRKMRKIAPAEFSNHLEVKQTRDNYKNPLIKKIEEKSEYIVGI